ncbi:SpoIIE family protein phosphatase [Streptomyces sp. NBC_01763]|uniref:SpoIIE family protein phosphatase n=1 Tax=Streptomyces sp. NBC_01763 TaxID=2975934 RepID=UPI002DD8E163|nr:SpoIIE family protein phosphatase [Streptomyces sp. NBC_01763]
MRTGRCAGRTATAPKGDWRPGSGARTIPRFTHEYPLPPSSTLLLFTDGLVEHRNRDIDTGLTALAGHAARLATAPLPQLCADLVAGHDQAFDDDVALLALRIPDSLRS